MKRQMEVAKRSSLEIPMAPGNSWLRDLYMSFSFKKILFAIPVLLAFFAMLLHGQQSGGSSDEFNLTMVGDSEIVTPAVVHQNNPRFMAIANAVRQGDAAFTALTLTGEDTLTLPEIGVSMPVAEFYEDVEFVETGAAE